MSSVAAETSLPASPDRPWLVRDRTEWRQIGIVSVYLAIMGTMLFVPATRSIWLVALACYFSFLNSVVIHNHLHTGIFRSKRLNMMWRCVLSFGALYPASANVPSHNLVHHQFDDDGDRDWADPRHVSFAWNLLNLIHFPNVAGPYTFAGVKRWAATTRLPDFNRQYTTESLVAFGLTGAALLYDFWGALFCVMVPQLWGARGILRINIIQHDRADINSEWNHSRNFVGRAFNWIMCNNGYHTIHHNRAGMHWSKLADGHKREVVGRIHPSLDEPSMLWYLVRTYLLQLRRPSVVDLAEREHLVGSGDLASRSERRDAAEEASIAEVMGEESHTVRPTKPTAERVA